MRRYFLRFCVIVFYWQFSWVVLFLLNSEAYSPLICKIGYSGIIFLPVSCYETVVHYLELPKQHIRWFYYLCLGFLVSLWTTEHFIKGAHLYSFGYYPEAGFLHVAYMAMVIVLMLLLFSTLFQVVRQEKERIRKKQLQYFAVCGFMFSFSAVDYLLNYPALVKMIGFQLYPVGVFFISFSVLVFILSHFITLSLTLEKRVKIKTGQLEKSIIALEESAQYKKDFIANVTHELRTPLTLIRGWTDFLLEGESGEVPHNIAETIQKIGVQTLHLTAKINELLKVSKFDAGMNRLVLTPMDIDSEIRQIVDSFKGLTDQRGLKLEYFGSLSLGKVFLDQEKITDIMNNLIRNAYKFTEKGEIKVILSRERENIVIRVKDTGIGMPLDVQEKIFQRFQQADSSKTRRYEGTGLGLAIVEESVRMMDGEILVESLEGQGTVFSILLPMDLENREPHALTDRRDKERRVKNEKVTTTRERRQMDRRLTDLAKIDSEDLVRILESETTPSSNTAIKKIEPEDSMGVIVIAEDNIGIQELLTKALSRYTLYIAANGQIAWQAIQEQMPDLVISDIMMPVMDGYTLLTKMREDKNTANLPVIIITSLTEQEDRIKTLQLGADDFLTKPFHHLELQARVKNVLSVHKLEREQTKSEQLEIFLMVLASVIESKDTYTGGHVERVAGFARDLARKANLSEDMVNDIYLGTIVHDVGKIGIKDEILNKPGRLTDEEFEEIKAHPVIGRNLLSKLEIAPIVVNITYYHQEKWDGTGYPEGLSKTDIPVEARIATIADFWDAITSDRPYRKAMPMEKAIEIMHEERGKSFDPDLFDLFMDEKERLYLKYIDEGSPQSSVTERMVTN